MTSPTTAATPGVAVDFREVTKTYRSPGGIAVTALDNVTLEVAPGESVALMGPSGSGKSTLLHLAGLMDLPDAGQIVIGGQTTNTLNEKQRAAMRRNIGFVFQRFHLLPALSAVDNVTAPLLPFKVGFDKHARAVELLDAVGLGLRKDHIPSRLSGGEQQRVAIARALINQPGMLLADEPTGNLDTHTGSQIVDLLLRLHAERGITILIATHDPDLAARCSRTVTIRNGQAHEQN